MLFVITEEDCWPVLDSELALLPFAQESSTVVVAVVASFGSPEAE